MEPSSKSSGAVRTFTIEEANELLPFITESLNKAFVLNERIRSLTNDIENLVAIWGKDVLERGHIDNAYYFSKVTERESAYQEMISRINEMQATGCVVKDIETGLVDFYFSNKGQIICLCWKYGEQRISHWHSVDEGFKSRKAIRRI